ncbi:hypothetical protein ITJ86_12385 [Winogradskyella sp. F6397]|uniref:DUF1640 domain-containing protein n=1 Tax=Winogradskyella marina TaxID=2785530 RepID=A0ABS0EPM9_9FLAO|nr:hypothetical protein [Winogradskyella marina]MBF8150701.1 hypothetical protein [Winogradskyella marina]
MTEHKDDLDIERNLKILCESDNPYEFEITNFENEKGRKLHSKYNSELFASLMEQKGLIRVNGYRCSVKKFGLDVFNSGGWIKYISDQEKQETELELKIQEKEALELENLKLQKEAAEHKKSMRSLETQISSLTRDNLRLGNWDIRFRWLIAVITFLIGFIVEYLIGN